MSRVRSLHALRGSFTSLVTAAVDTTDVLRAEVVLAVSALDHYVHELTRLGMLECWVGSRLATAPFGKFPLPMSVASTLTSVSSATNAVDAEIRLKHSFIPFQQPEKIADAIRLFSDVRLWEAVGAELGEPAATVKGSLQLIVERRNKIAHEADIDPSYPGQRWPIDPTMVENIFDRLEKIAKAIFKVVI